MTLSHNIIYRDNINSTIASNSTYLKSQFLVKHPENMKDPPLEDHLGERVVPPKLWLTAIQQ